MYYFSSLRTEECQWPLKTMQNEQDTLSKLKWYSQGFWYFAEKKQNFAGFSGANSRKNRPISREKSQNSRNNRPISGDFRGRKVKIRRKIGPFRGILAEKSQFLRDFQGQIIS